MRDLQYLATAHLQGACVTVSDQVHGLFRLKAPRQPRERRHDLVARPTGGADHVFALACATARLAGNASGTPVR